MRNGIFNAEEIDTLGSLSDPTCWRDPLSLQGSDQEECLWAIKTMMLIRKAEEEIGRLVESGEVKCPCHLGIGQEGVATGISAALEDGDGVYGGHRSHSHYLAQGGSLQGLISEVFGKVDGCSHGFGGSMHLYQPEVGFYGSVPIVGATIPISVGAAMAKKMAGSNGVVVSYFGDGAAEEGAFHESLNLAASQKSPVLFVCENNLYASHMDIKLRQPHDMVSRLSVAHKIPSYVVDGNDFLAVKEAASELIKQLRAGEGPGFIEAITYRHRGHVGPDENIDVGVRRKQEDIDNWKMRDPINRLKSSMLDTGMLTQAEFAELVTGITAEVTRATEVARTSEFPPEEALLGAVFKGGFQNV